MAMLVYTEIDFDYLQEHCWSHALSTVAWAERHHLQDELMDLLETVFEGETPSITSVNDYLWFHSDEIKKLIGSGITEEDE